MTERRDVYELVTERVIQALENGTVPWRRTWNPDLGAPKSLSTGKPYRGVNPFLLGIAATAGGYRSPWWGTYKWIAGHGGQIRKGEKSTLVVFWKSYTKRVQDDDGNEENQRRFVLRYYLVFNADQADWNEGAEPVYEPLDTSEAERIEAAERIVRGYPYPPQIRNGAAAYYTGAVDTVTTPPIGAFEDAEMYYATMFHELTHSTGHKSRLAREGVRDGSFGKFGDAVYSKEELVAEMGSALLCGVAGIDTKATVDSSAAYLRSWVAALRGDSKLVVQAAAQAQHAADHVLAVTFGKGASSPEPPAGDGCPVDVPIP